MTETQPTEAGDEEKNLELQGLELELLARCNEKTPSDFVSFNRMQVGYVLKRSLHGGQRALDILRERGLVTTITREDVMRVHLDNGSTIEIESGIQYHGYITTGSGREVWNSYNRKLRQIDFEKAPTES
jgi:hypothetical protein